MVTVGDSEGSVRAPRGSSPRFGRIVPPGAPLNLVPERLARPGAGPFGGRRPAAGGATCADRGRPVEAATAPPRAGDGGGGNRRLPAEVVCRGRVGDSGPAVARRPGGTALRGQGRCAGLGDAGRGWHGASVRSLCPRTRRGLTCRAGQPSMSRVRHHAGRWNGNRAMRAPVLPRRERARRPSRGPVRGRVASAGRRPGHLDNTFVVVRPGLVPLGLGRGGRRLRGRPPRTPPRPSGAGIGLIARGLTLPVTARGLPRRSSGPVGVERRQGRDRRTASPTRPAAPTAPRGVV